MNLMMTAKKGKYLVNNSNYIIGMNPSNLKKKGEEIIGII